MGLLERLGLRKQEKVVCADCKYFIPYVEEEESGYEMRSPQCEFSLCESLDYISGKLEKVYAQCSTLNSKGECKHFARKIDRVRKIEN